MGVGLVSCVGRVPQDARANKFNVRSVQGDSTDRKTKSNAFSS